MKANVVKLFTVVALALIVSACSGDSPTSPTGSSTASVQGTWSGTITNSEYGGRGPARVTVSQTGSSLSGTWYAMGPYGADSGSLTGSVSGSAVSITLSPSDPTNCPTKVTAIVSGTSMSGTYAAFNCAAPLSGGVTLTKQ